MNKYQVMQEFFDGSESTSYVVNEGMLIKEGVIRELVDNSDTVIFNYDEGELIIDLENKGINATISYL